MSNAGSLLCQSQPHCRPVPQRWGFTVLSPSQGRSRGQKALPCFDHTQRRVGVQAAPLRPSQVIPGPSARNMLACSLANAYFVVQEGQSSATPSHATYSSWRELALRSIVPGTVAAACLAAHPALADTAATAAAQGVGQVAREITGADSAFGRPWRWHAAHHVPQPQLLIYVFADRRISRQ